MYALASLGLRCSAGGFCAAGAAFGALQEVGCTPWRPLLSAGFSMVGAAFGASASGRMYALASPCLRCSAGGFCVAGAALGALQGVGCTPWRPGLRCFAGGFCGAGAALGALQGRMYALASLGLRFAWQAQHLVLFKGSDVRPGVPWSPLLFAWQAQHLLLCKGSDVRPWRALVSAALPVAFGTGCSARGRIRPARPLVSAALRVGFAWQARHLVPCKGSDTPWRPLVSGGFCVAGAAIGALQGVGCTSGVPWSQLLFAWQAQHLLRCKGSDVRPGVPWSPPLCR